MRITQSNLNQLSVNMTKLPPDIRSQLGKILTGQIVSIQSDKLATLVSGSTELTVQISDIKLTENQVIQLQITGYEEGHFTAKLLPESINVTQSNQMDYMVFFDKMGLPNTKENRQILDAMIKANLPIDTDTFSRMRQGLLEVKIVAGELKTPEVLILTTDDFEVPMKELAIKLIQNTHVNSIPEAVVSISGEQIERETLRVMPQNDLGVNEMPLHNKPELPYADTIQNPLELERVLGQMIFSSENTNVPKDAILPLLDQFSPFDESMMIKHELPLTIKNMFLTSMGAFQNDKNMERFLRVLSQLEQSMRSSDLKNILTEVLTSQLDPVEKLNQMITVIRSTQITDKDKMSLENDLTILKESANLTKSFNEPIMYLPIPVIIHKEPEIAHLYLKKGKHKFNPDDLTLLVALNTHHYGEVRVLIHKKKSQVDLNFSFESEEAKLLYEGLQEVLTEGLARFTGYMFKISFTVKDERVNKGFEDAVVSTSGFDLKV